MPHHWHPVTAEDEPLNITEIECALRKWSRTGTRFRGLMPVPEESCLFGNPPISRCLMPASPEQVAEESPAFFCLCLVCFLVLVHYLPELACDLLSAIRAWMS